MFKKIKKTFLYIICCFSNLRGLSEAVNVASSPDELDQIVTGGKI